MPTLENALERLERIEILLPSSGDRHKVFADVAAVYDNRKVELTEDGHIIVMPPVSLEGGYQSGEVFYQLADWARKNRTGKAFDSSSGFYITPNQNRSPDAAWVSNERLALVPKKARRSFASFCPDFAIEVKSPSNSLIELREKCRSYVLNGAHEAWIVDPERRIVEVIYASDPSLFHQSIDSVAATGPLSGFILDLLPVWQGLGE